MEKLADDLMLPSIEIVHLSGDTFRFPLQENELFSVITQTVPLECTHQELLSEQNSNL